MPYIAIPKGQKFVKLLDSFTQKRSTWSVFSPSKPPSVSYATWNNCTVGMSSVDRRTGPKTELLPGVLWKPVHTYARACLTVGYPMGKVIVDFKPTVSNRPPHDYIIEGSLGSTAHWTVGPFVSASGSGVTTVAMPSIIRNRLATEVMLKVGERKTNYGESIAEARSTIRQISNSAVTLFRAYRYARKGDWNRVARALNVRKRDFKSSETSSQRWLGYQYGWMPLMADIYDSASLLQDGFRKKAFVMSDVRNLSDSHSSTADPPLFAKQKITGRSTVNYRAKIFYRVNDSDLSRMHQMGLINPLEVVWAIVPFSFVVDWFLPIGNMLEACSARMGVTFIDGYYSTRVSGLYLEYDRRNVPSNRMIVENTLHTRTEVFAYRRDRIGSFPVPGFYFKDPFSSTHLVSALALIRQLLR